MKKIFLTLIFLSLFFGDNRLVAAKKDSSSSNFHQVTSQGIKTVCDFYELNYDEYIKVFEDNPKKVRAFDVICPIKSGTNLLIKSLSLITGLPHSGLLGTNFDKLKHGEYYFLSDHFYKKEKVDLYVSSNTLTYSIIRDPRDILISQCHWYKYKEEKDQRWKNSGIQQRCQLLIEDPRYFGSSTDIKFQLSLLKDLMTRKDIYLAHFESLIGKKGGGDLTLQTKEIQKLGAYLGISLTKRQMNYIVANLFGKSYSFRKGEIGTWKKYFDGKIKSAFKENFNDLLIEYGYEKDENW